MNRIKHIINQNRDWEGSHIGVNQQIITFGFEHYSQGQQFP